jgi:altronate hydrolase
MTAPTLADPRAWLRLHPDDNVLVANKALPEGTRVEAENISCVTPIPAGHKLASRSIAEAEPIRKYGQIIGFASRAIASGEHVHTHNCAMRDFFREHRVGSEARATAYVHESGRARFQGIVRADGRVATRNYLGIVTTVNCSATVARAIAERFRGERLAGYPNVDGVVAIVHTTGCGMGGNGEGLRLLQRTLAGYARHPNFAGVLFLGLGCEINQPDLLVEAQELRRSELLQQMSIQGSGGTRAAIEEGVERIQSMLPHANRVSREPVSASHLTLGLQCGGSDGYSGITANPALGAAVDLLVRHGGSGILSETPEIYGAEHLLTRRAVSLDVAEKLLRRIAWWEEYTRMHGGEMNNNPSPGNKEGGLTTILEKSLGAAAKGGTSNLVDVYEYAEPITQRGFVFMDSPGYDPCSVTGQVASGANMVCFTTGRGSVFGCKPVPSIKIATNSAMYRRMNDDMDVNCGSIVDGEASVEQMGQRIFELILAVASGKKSKSEELDFGDNEFVPWQLGAVM